MDAVVLVDAAGRQPLHAAYRRSVAGIVGELLAADERRMAALLERLRVRVVYTLELRSPWFILAFSGACLASSAYGFLQGAWPFGVVELVWSGVAARRWWSRSRFGA